MIRPPPSYRPFPYPTLFRSAGATPPATATSGSLVTDAGKTATSFTDTGLASGTQYSYALFAHDAIPNYATAATNTAITSAQHTSQLQPRSEVIAPPVLPSET